jgi:hypothetical protein
VTSGRLCGPRTESRLTFDSEEEAEVEIAETLEDLQEAYELGDMSSPMTRDEFRIVAL